MSPLGGRDRTELSARHNLHIRLWGKPGLGDSMTCACSTQSWGPASVWMWWPAEQGYTQNYKSSQKEKKRSNWFYSRTWIFVNPFYIIIKLGNSVFHFIKDYFLARIPYFQVYSSFCLCLTQLKCSYTANTETTGSSSHNWTRSGRWSPAKKSSAYYVNTQHSKCWGSQLQI